MNILNKLTAGCLILFVMLAMALGMAQSANADGPPPIPEQFYGKVVIDGSPASTGTTVSIYINGAEVASTTTDAQGRYGYSTLVKLSGSNGATVEFYVNGVKAQESTTFSSGAIVNVDLSAGEGSSPPSEPPPSPPPPAPPPPGTEPPPSEPPPQSPPQSSPSISVSITASVLGQSNSIQLSEMGVLENAVALSSADGKVKLNFKANTTIDIQGESLTVTKEVSPPSPPADIELVDAYNFNPSNTTFNPALTLAFNYDPSGLPEGVTESGLFIAYWNGSDWAPMTTTADSQDNSLTTQVSHLTIFAILGMKGEAAPPSPASFAVSNLKVSPSSVKPGEAVTITADVKNSGGSEGSYAAVLKINNVNEAETEAAVGAGETEKVAFIVTKGTAGAYNVSIDGQGGAFTVSTSGASPFASEALPLIAVVAFGGLLVIILVIVLLRRRAY